MYNKFRCKTNKFSRNNSVLKFQTILDIIKIVCNKKASSLNKKTIAKKIKFDYLMPLVKNYESYI